MKIFNHVIVDGLDYKLKQINESTGRRYKTPEGNLYPSITTVLSSYNKQGLMECPQTSILLECNP